MPHLLAEIHWNADPILFEIGKIALRWYGLLFAGGFLVTFAIARWMYALEGKPDKDLDALLIHTLLGTVIGARLMHCFAYEPAYFLQHPFEVLKIWRGGLASHGGAIPWADLLASVAAVALAGLASGWVTSSYARRAPIVETLKSEG